MARHPSPPWWSVLDDPNGDRSMGKTYILSTPRTPAFAAGAAEQSVHTFSATLKTAGTQSLTATDIANGAVAGLQTSILVNAAAASRLLLSAPASVKAGAKFSLTVTVVDAYGNVVTGYRGTIGYR